MKPIPPPCMLSNRPDERADGLVGTDLEGLQRTKWVSEPGGSASGGPPGEGGNLSGFLLNVSREHGAIGLVRRHVSG